MLGSPLAGVLTRQMLLRPDAQGAPKADAQRQMLTRQMLIWPDAQVLTRQMLRSQLLTRLMLRCPKADGQVHRGLVIARRFGSSHSLVLDSASGGVQPWRWYDFRILHGMHVLLHAHAP